MIHPSLAKAGETYKKRLASGEIVLAGTPHTKEAKEKISKYQSEKMNKPEFGSYQHVPFYDVKNVDGDVFTLRGYYEKDTAEILNEMNYLWTTGQVLRYQLGFLRRYHPDLYIHDLDFYIEVKGAFSQKDKKKMRLVRDQCDVSIGIAFRKEIDKLIETRDLDEFIKACKKNLAKL